MNSVMCTKRQLTTTVFDEWRARMYEPKILHRKVWEYCYIAQALYEHGVLRPGSRGLGFAVGQEPLPALFASLDCNVTATDLYRDQAEVWSDTGQHAWSVESLRRGGICTQAQMEQHVSFEFVDMRNIPTRFYDQYDFVWSACAMEHLGSLDLGLQFVMDSLTCLKPGGIAVHTTELNLSSNIDTLDSGPVVLYRKSDLNRLRHALLHNGWFTRLDFSRGMSEEDQYIDMSPYNKGIAHLRLAIGGYMATSFGIVITEKKEANLAS